MEDNIFTNIQQMRYVRNSVENKLADWLGLDQGEAKVRKELSILLEFKPRNTSREECENMSILEWTSHHEKVFEKLKQLDGPHGYAVFRALKLKAAK